MTTVSVCVPTIPMRATMLQRALGTVVRQTRPADQVVVQVDRDAYGASATRNRAWRAADSEWIAFLDDDDELEPHHIQTLLDYSTGADLVYPWFTLPEATDPLAAPENGVLRSPFGLEFGREQADYIETTGNFIPVTVLVRRELLWQVGGFPQPGTTRWPNDHCEDWGCWRDMIARGARFVHAPVRTWTWHHHGGNTSGRPWR